MHGKTERTTPAGWTILKDGAHRAVYRTGPQADGAPRLVKCFRARGWLRRRFDGRRARREARVLARLHAAGLPVPAPLAVRRDVQGWELWSEWIPAAVTLAELIEGSAPWPRPPRQLAPELGRILARAQRTGLVHPDLHPGNVLIDARGALWLVDFTQARLARRARAELAERELVRLEAAVREVLPFSLRARCLRGWLAERSPLATVERDALAVDIAARARRERRALLERERDRWLRTSSRCVRAEPGLVVRRGAAPLSPSERRTLAECDEVERLHTEPGRSTLSRGGRNVRADWLELGRAVDHHLPAARPLALGLERRPRALFELPVGAARIERPSGVDARSAGRLVGALSDRGLGLRGDPRAGLVATVAGEVLLGPGVRFAALGEAQLERATDALRALFEARDGPRAASFERGRRAALRRAPDLRQACSADAGVGSTPPRPSAAASGSASTGRPPQPPPMAL